MESTPPFSSFPPIKITDEQFNAYHSIDRQLFFALIHMLDRDSTESMHVVAFLIWLEINLYSYNTVLKSLDLPLHLVNQLCDEIISCLRCLEDNDFSNKWRVDLYWLPKLCSRHVSLYHFHQNRTRVAIGVSKIISDVCVRGFRDIIQLKIDEYKFDKKPDFWKDPIYRSLGGVLSHQVIGGNTRMSLHQNMPNEIVNPFRDPNSNLSEYFGGINLANGFEDEPDVPEEDRSIFLTFSKGYYIAESEIKDFFTRIFGDFIEAIYMQDVSSDEQPLYAKMVARSSSIIPAIVFTADDSKAKYSINGKNIWAKKYVKKKCANSSPPPEA